MLLSLRISIVELESALQDQIDGLNFCLKDVVQRLFIDFFDVRGLLGKNFVTSEECLDGVDADGNEILPGNVTRFVFICQSEQNSDIVFRQIVSR